LSHRQIENVKCNQYTNQGGGLIEEEGGCGISFPEGQGLGFLHLLTERNGICIWTWVNVQSAIKEAWLVVIWPNGSCYLAIQLPVPGEPM
jgi:hypothetical protein